VPYCVALKQDGAPCITGLECLSEACVGGFCQTPPLALGDPCTSSDQCDSNFCSLDPIGPERVCKELPLPLGEPCSSSEQCDSLVCFNTGTETTCISGLGEDQPCGDIDQPDCDPHELFCDTVDEDPPVCVRLHETGQECDRGEQCRSGSCAEMYGRLLCSPAAPRDLAVCDGPRPSP
jgi:hypothetical protein